MIQENKIYIFLDIDGVLNNETHIEKCWENNRHHSMHMNYAPFDPECLNNLMLLCHSLEDNKYKFEIILSSTWRLHEIDYEIVNARLAEYGLHLSGKTDYIHNERGKEIQAFLNAHTDEYMDFIILDDDKNDIIPYYPNKLVQTNFMYGFNKEMLQKALKYFNL